MRADKHDCPESIQRWLVGSQSDPTLAKADLPFVHMGYSWQAMRTLLVLLSLVATHAACSDAPAQAQAPTRYSADSVERLMVGRIEPAADHIWDSVSSTISFEGIDERFPRTDQEWAAVRRSALTLAEAGKLLATGNRSRDNGEWAKRARALVEAALETVKAAEARSPDAILETGEKIYNACIGCHQRYPGRMQNQ